MHLDVFQASCRSFWKGEEVHARSWGFVKILRVHLCMVPAQWEMTGGLECWAQQVDQKREGNALKRPCHNRLSAIISEA